MIFIPFDNTVTLKVTLKHSMMPRLLQYFNFYAIFNTMKTLIYEKENDRSSLYID